MTEINQARKAQNIVAAMFGGEYVTYNVNFGRCVGGIGPAIFTQYVVRWTAGEDSGWCWRTEDEIEQDTLLTARQQRGIREKLKASGVLRERRAGNPARMYYQIDHQALLRILAGCGELVLTKVNNKSLQNVTTSPDILSGHLEELTNKESTRESPLSPPKGESTRKKPRTGISEGWVLDQAGQEYAREFGMSEKVIDLEAEKFYQHWRSTGEPKADWHATWCKWVATWASGHKR